MVWTIAALIGTALTTFTLGLITGVAFGLYATNDNE
jgi:hypothetical protein